MIFVGIDDTDTIDTRGTNKLAIQIVHELREHFRCHWIARHQMLYDERIPYTSKNGSASIVLEATGTKDVHWLREQFEKIMLREFIVGSDPGLCVVEHTSKEPIGALVEWAQLCQREIVTREAAIAVAKQAGVFLKGLGGTNGGMIGALAAVGLAMVGNDGRVIQRGNVTEEPSGWQSLAALQQEGVTVRTWPAEEVVTAGMVDVGKKLRPNLRERGFVLFVESALPANSEDSPHWRALKLL